MLGNLGLLRPASDTTRGSYWTLLHVFHHFVTSTEPLSIRAIGVFHKQHPKNPPSWPWLRLSKTHRLELGKHVMFGFFAPISCKELCLDNATLKILARVKLRVLDFPPDDRKRWCFWGKDLCWRGAECAEQGIYLKNIVEVCSCACACTRVSLCFQQTLWKVYSAICGVVWLCGYDEPV